MKAKYQTFLKKLGEWKVSWESNGDYRLWCYQCHPSNSKDAVVVMLNPGSLSGKGEKLTKDTTLRILRELFNQTGYNPYIINLFDLSSPKPAELFSKWSRRDHGDFLLKDFDEARFSAVMYAYGDYENTQKNFSRDIKERIKEFRERLNGIPSFDLPLNKSGTPKHPMVIQTQKLMSVAREKIQTLKSNKAGYDNSVTAPPSLRAYP